MVTRYTIDQILSRGISSSPRTPPSPTTITTPHSPLWRPTSLADAPLEPRHYLTPHRESKEAHHRDAKTETLITDDDVKTRHGMESRAEDVHPLARPVALHPLHSLPLPHHDATTLDALALRSDLGYGGLEGGVYGLMLRQYMEAQFHLGAPRTFLPLALHGFDSGLVHPGGGGRTRRRGGQVRFTPQQTRQLETWFAQHKYITPPQRKTIARELSLHEKQVKTWFQNRRAKWRKVQAQGGGEEESTGALDMAACSPASSHDGSEDSEHHLAGEGPEGTEGVSLADDSEVLYKN